MRLLIDFLNHREGGLVFYKVFFLSPIQGPVTELRKYELHEYEVELTVNSKEENSEDFFVWISSKTSASGHAVLYMYFNKKECALTEL
jgi:hypothetical protein